MTALVVLSVLGSGALAAVIRYLVTRAFPVRPGHIPGGVLIVNVLGSAAGGAVLALAERAQVSPEVSLIILTGVCGGLTTFSTWSVETVELAVAGHWRTAAMNVGSNVVLGIGAAALAYLALR